MKKTGSDNLEDPVDTMVRSTLSDELPDEVRSRLEARLTAFRHQVAYRHAGDRPGWQLLMARTALAFSLAIVAVAVWAAVGGRGTEPTWAQVAERFASVRFLSTTVYVKQSASSSPVQLELWMAPGGRLRMLAGHEVFFGVRGAIEERVPFAAPPANEAAIREARHLVHDVIEGLGQADQFSLETLVEALPLQDIVAAPLANQDARIASDLVVFDMADDGSPAWLRIWALRESRLPVRMLYWDPRTGESVDAVLNYAHEQPADFFDPRAFSDALAAGDVASPGRGYTLLKDPGGRPITSADLTEDNLKEEL